MPAIFDKDGFRGLFRAVAKDKGQDLFKSVETQVASISDKLKSHQLTDKSGAEEESKTSALKSKKTKQTGRIV